MFIHCRTNLDLGRSQTWPKLEVVPQIGGLVKSNGGMVLQVDEVTYYNEFGHTHVDVYLKVPYGESISAWDKRMRVQGFHG